MGTYNRVLRLARPGGADAYLEIIAIDPAAVDPGHARWFDMDDPVLAAAVNEAPRLVHFVASTIDIVGAAQSLASLGIDRGEALAAQRETPNGMLRWRITVRNDGQRLLYGLLPALIQWEGAHPSTSMPDSGIELRSMHAHHPRPADLGAAYDAIGLRDVEVCAGPPNLVAQLQTPRGAVTLESRGA